MESLPFSAEEREALLEMSFADCIASFLNRLFDTEIKPTDLDFGIGRYPVRLTKLGHKMVVGECWHTAAGTFADSINRIACLLGAEKPDTDGGWRRIGICCAILGGALGQMLQSGAAEKEQGVNFAAMAGDFSMLMSAWYLRSWGFPIAKILCCSAENDGLWELFHNGMLQTDGIVPLELDRLLYHLAGAAEAERFSQCCRTGATYYTCETLQPELLRQIQVYPIGEKRISSTISGIFGSNYYVLPPDAAGAYAGAMDDRWVTGDKKTVLFTAEKSPEWDAGIVAEALHISEQTFRDYWKNR